jgi:uncharacterized protein YegP (UPF0339 family)
MLSIYQSEKNQEWYWQLKAANGEIVAGSSEGFASKANAINNLLITHSMLSTELARLAQSKLDD